MFLCSGDSCECQTLHSNCPRHTLQARTMTRCPWPRFRAPVTLSWFYIDSSIKVGFSAAVIAASVKPCIVIVQMAAEGGISASVINFLVLCSLVTKFYLLPYMLCSCDFAQCRCDVDFAEFLLILSRYVTDILKICIKKFDAEQVFFWQTYRVFNLAIFQ